MFCITSLHGLPNSSTIVSFNNRYLTMRTVADEGGGCGAAADKSLNMFYTYQVCLMYFYT